MSQLVYDRNLRETVPTPPIKITVEPEASHIAAALVDNSGDGNIHVGFLKIHLDQPYAPELLNEIAKQSPEKAMELFIHLKADGLEVPQEALAVAVDGLSSIHKLTKFEEYRFLPSADTIRNEALADVIQYDPWVVLNAPWLLDSDQDASAKFIDCYQRSTGKYRADILSSISNPIESSATKNKSSDQLEIILGTSSGSVTAQATPNLNEKKDSTIRISDELVKDAFTNALYFNQQAIQFDPAWLSKQDWFKEIVPDLEKVVKSSDPKMALRGLALLADAGVAIPQDIVDKMIERIVLENTGLILDADWDEGFKSLGLKPEQIQRLKGSSISLAILEHPVFGLDCLKIYGEELFSQEELARLRQRAITHAIGDDPQGFISHAIDNPRAGETGEMTLATTALCLAQLDPKQLLANYKYLSPLNEIIRKQLVIGAFEKVLESDPKAALDFIKENEHDTLFYDLFTGVDYNTLFTRAAVKAPEEVFNNFGLVLQNSKVDDILRVAVANLSAEQILRFTGMSSVDPFLSQDQLRRVKENMSSIGRWINNSYSPNYLAFFADQPTIRALRIDPSWIDANKNSDYDRDDLRLIIGRNLYEQKRPINEVNVKDELNHIEFVRQKYGDVELFKNKTILFVANNEQWKGGSSRFSKDSLVQSLSEATDKTLEQFVAAPGERDAEKEKNDFLDRVRNCEGPITVFVNAHGSEVGIFSLVNDQTYITTEELAAAFNARLSDRLVEGSIDPDQRDVVILSSCYSYDIARLFYDGLDKDNNQSLPIVIGGAELGQVSYSSYTSNMNSNFVEHVLGLGQISENSKSSHTVKDVIQNQIGVVNSNVFIFAPNEKVPFLQIAALDALKLPKVAAGAYEFR